MTSQAVVAECMTRSETFTDPPATACWSQLPEELLQLVAQHCRHHALANARRTCTQWCSAFSGCVRDLQLDIPNALQTWQLQLSLVSHAFPSLVSMKVQANRLMPIEAMPEAMQVGHMMQHFEALALLPQLAHLHLNMAFVPLPSGPGFAALSGLTNLRSFTAEYTDLSLPDGLQSLACLWALTELRFKGCTGLCDNLVEQLVAAVPRLRVLEFVAASAFQELGALTDAGMQALVVGLPRLEQLVLHQLKWSDKVTCRGYEAIAGLQHLQVLEADVGSAAMVAPLVRLSQLRELHLDSDFGAIALPLLRACFGLVPVLTRLDVHFVERGSSEVFRLLNCLTALTELDCSVKVEPLGEAGNADAPAPALAAPLLLPQVQSAAGHAGRGIDCELSCLSSLSCLKKLSVKKRGRRFVECKMHLSGPVLRQMAAGPWQALRALDLYLDRGDYVPGAMRHFRQELPKLRYLGLHMGFHLHPLGAVIVVYVDRLPPALSALSVSNARLRLFERPSHQATSSDTAAAAVTAAAGATRSTYSRPKAAPGCGISSGGGWQAIGTAGSSSRDGAGRGSCTVGAAGLPESVAHGPAGGAWAYGTDEASDDSGSFGGYNVEGYDLDSESGPGVDCGLPELCVLSAVNSDVPAWLLRALGQPGLALDRLVLGGRAAGTAGQLASAAQPAPMLGRPEGCVQAPSAHGSPVAAHLPIGPRPLAAQRSTVPPLPSPLQSLVLQHVQQSATDLRALRALTMLTHLVLMAQEPHHSVEEVTSEGSEASEDEGQGGEGDGQGADQGEGTGQGRDGVQGAGGGADGPAGCEGAGALQQQGSAEVPAASQIGGERDCSSAGHARADCARHVGASGGGDAAAAAATSASGMDCGGVGTGGSTAHAVAGAVAEGGTTAAGVGDGAAQGLGTGSTQARSDGHGGAGGCDTCGAVPGRAANQSLPGGCGGSSVAGGRAPRGGLELLRSFPRMRQLHLSWLVGDIRVREHPEALRHGVSELRSLRHLSCPVVLEQRGEMTSFLTPLLPFCKLDFT